MKFSSPPLNRKITLCLKILSDLDRTRSISIITAQPAPSSLAPVINYLLNTFYVNVTFTVNFYKYFYILNVYFKKTISTSYF